MPLPQVEDLADTTFAQKISQLPGVGLVTISGGQKPAVRIQANPTALASYGLSLEQLRTVIGQVNVNQAKGQLQDNRLAYTIGANDQLFDPKQYADTIIAYKNGAPVRVSDVANVIEGPENANQAAWMNTTPAVIHQHPAAAGRQHHQGRRQHQAAPEATAGQPAQLPSRSRC